jgi:hypothetical protein
VGEIRTRDVRVMSPKKPAAMALHASGDLLM